VDEWDVGPAGAEWILREEYPGWDQPDRYHLCLISNFLTLPQVLEEAAEALHGVRSTLPSGGMIAVVGSGRRGARYGPIYQELRRQLGGLHHLRASGAYRPRVDEESESQLRTFNLNIRQRLTDLGADVDRAMSDWPTGIPRLVLQRWKPDNRVVLLSPLHSRSVPGQTSSGREPAPQVLEIVVVSRRWQRTRRRGLTW
jgi:hypothetical protein